MNLLNQFVESKTKFNLTENQVKSLNLIDKGHSLEEINFLNKEEGSDVQYWQLDLFESLVREYKDLEKKKLKIITDIEHQNIDGKEELLDQIRKLTDNSQLEDIYRPFKRRKKTKATLAREAGLAEFADWILDVAYGKADSSVSLEVKAKEYLKPALGFVTYDIVLKGAQDIIVDRLLKKPEIRQKLSELYYGQALLKVEKTDKFKNTKYTALLNFKEKVSSLLETKNYYKFPMVKKAWEEGQLKVLLEVDKSELVESLKSETLKLPKENPWAGFITEAFHKAIDIHVIPSITQEVIEELLALSETETIKRLKQDYQKILMTPAFGEKSVLSFTQLKDSQIEMALITDLGELVSATSIAVDKETSKEDFKNILDGITKQISLGALAIGLGPYSRTIESFILSCFDNDLKQLPAPIAFVDMRGISSFVHTCYENDKSKSRLEYTLLSLARRMQDPLMELAKYSGKSLLDIPAYVSDEKLLPELNKVLKHCVSVVGLDINKADLVHLGLIPGLSSEMSEKIISFRTQKSRFVEKAQLRTELNMSEEDFDLCSSFLKVMISKSVLDRAQLSGKDFPAIKDLLKDQNLTTPLDIKSEQEAAVLESKWKTIFGEKKLKFILKELKNPYADPRRPYKFFGFSDKLKSLNEIKVGWNYPALVTKFSSFGVFVDLGVQQEGLIHLSELSNEYVSDPRKVVGIGEWIYVNVIDFKIDKKLISLSKIKAEKSTDTKNKTDKRSFKPRANSASKDNRGESKRTERFKSDKPKISDRPKRTAADIRSDFKSMDSSHEGFQKKSEDANTNKSNQRNNVRTYETKGKDGQKPFNRDRKENSRPSADGDRASSNNERNFRGRDQKSNGDRSKDRPRSRDQQNNKNSNKSQKTPFNNPFAALSNLNIDKE
jgi:protein Tex